MKDWVFSIFLLTNIYLLKFQGYKKYLSKIFVKAGYMLSEETKSKISEVAIEKENAAKEEKAKTFVDVYTCREVSASC